MPSEGSAASPRPLPWWTWVLPGLVCQLGTQASLATMVSPGVSATYLPIPLALVMSFWWGPRVLVGVFLNAMFSASLWDLERWRLYPVYAIPETAAVFVGWLLFTRIGKGQCWLPDLRNLIKFLLLAVLPAAVLNGFYVEGQFVLLGDQQPEEFWSQSFEGFVATVLDGIAIAAPLAFFLTAPLERRGLILSTGTIHPLKKTLQTLVPVVWLEIGLVFCGIALLSNMLPLNKAWIIYGMFVLWAAVRHGAWMALLINLWLEIVIMLLPPLLARLGHDSPDEIPLETMRMSLAILCLAGVIIGRAVSDYATESEYRKSAEDELSTSRANLSRALSDSQRNAIGSRENKERFQALFEQASDGIFLTDSSGRYIEVNPAGVELLGFSRSEILAMRIPEILPPEEQGRLAGELSNLATGKPARTEWRILKKDGSSFHGEIDARQLPDGTVLALLRDVTLRKKEEQVRSKLLFDLGERVKELSALHKASRLLLEERPLNQDLLASMVALLPPAWKCPEVCEARICYGELEARTPGWRESPWKQTAAIETRSGMKGSIEVVYLEERPAEAEGPFLAEERSLLQSLADKLAGYFERKQAERALMELEARQRLINERFSLAVEAARIGVWELDFVRNLLVWDEQMCRLYGISSERFSGTYQDWAKGLHPEDLPRAHEAVQLARDGVKPFDTEFRVIWPNGEVRHLRAFARLVKDEAGTPIRMTGVNYDITESKRAAEALGASERMLREFIRHAPAAIAVLDNNMCYLQASGQYLKDYSLIESEIIGRSHYEIFPDIPERWKEGHKRVLAGAVERCEEDFVQRADGSSDWLQWELRPWYKSGGGIGGVILFTQLITQRKRSEQAMRASEARLSAILDNSPNVAIQGYDQVGRVLFWNKASEQIFGYTSQEALGKTLFKLTRSREQELEFLGMLKEVAAAGAPKGPYEVRFRRKDGRDGVSVSTLFRIPTPDGQGMFISMDVDVTERWLLESRLQHAQKMDSIGRLAGGVAHDFNNLLTGIIGYADLVLSDPTPHPRTRNIAEIRKIGIRAGNLTRQLLSFSRQQVVEPRFIDLNTIVTEMKNMLGRLIEGGIEIKFKLAGEPTGLVADPGQIEQILLNLVVNARDASSGSGEILVGTLHENLEQPFLRHGFSAPPGKYVGLAVQDAGCGMSPEIIEHIFEPYFTTKAMGKGTGLGLSMVFGIVKKLNGYVDIVSTPGAGSTFRVLLPAAERREITRIQPVQKLQSTGEETILLVDDEETILEVASRGLREYGYRVLPANTPELALEIARTHDGPIHLLVSDVVLPRRSGPQVAEGVVKHRPGISVLFTSGYTEDETVLHGVSQRSINFLEKPFTLEQLTLKVRNVLSREGPSVGAGSPSNGATQAPNSSA